jgi:hypothetical protein
VPSDSEGTNCASEATQILRLNNEQNLRYLNILVFSKSYMSNKVNKEQLKYNQRRKVKNNIVNKKLQY